MNIFASFFKNVFTPEMDNIPSYNPAFDQNVNPISEFEIMLCNEYWTR